MEKRWCGIVPGNDPAPIVGCAFSILFYYMPRRLSRSISELTSPFTISCLLERAGIRPEGLERWLGLLVRHTVDCRLAVLEDWLQESIEGF